MSSTRETLCPSAQPDWDDAQIFAVVGGTPDRPETAYPDNAQAVTDESLALASPVTPTEVCRIAAPCAKGRCQHFDDDHDRCRLAHQTVRLTRVSVHKLVHCAIRQSCRRWQQEGHYACQYCPQVVTVNYAPSPEMREAADPEVC